ncbi:PIN domain-containing protein [Aquimarina sp. RZ0]|uniref:PIN domain-containing protein n=1 Tax=Aquimarina sp. RZ0 TaxID=2607730 RepID=UPI0011F26D99|nr:PIN domain-containing protein [Aquimarina sp. RZ0]KAA1244553.1 type II toxin-antitoxin system VapC family toxin [Aquimarina sp. RZ0]
MNLFIDTNIYLKFYHFTNDELEELSKLIVLLKEEKIKLYIPKQVLNEFKRNREVKIADALKKLKAEKLNNVFPVFCKEYGEYSEMKKAISEYEKNKKELLNKLTVSIESYSLKADMVIKNLFEQANTINYSEDLIEKSKLRYDLGNPPGKKQSYGDALNWESLLVSIENGEDLYFLSDDKDYFSEIDNKQFNKFLENEWQASKKSDIIFYKSLSEFFKDKYPDIKLASELQKDILIDKLEDSGSFKVARTNLNRLFSFNNFTSNQIEKIFRIVCNNNQIYNIGSDFDINYILFSWCDEYCFILSDETTSLFQSRFRKNEYTDDDEDPPF